MYCSRCGKKLRDDMLFCPYCGTPATIPDENDANAVSEENAAPDSGEWLVFPERVEEKKPAEQDRESVVSLFDLHDELKTDEDYEELKFDSPQEDAKPEPASEPESVPEIIDIPEERQSINLQKRRESTLIQTPEAAKLRSAKTIIPVQDVDPDNIFMDEPDDYDAYDDDAYDDDDYSGDFDDEDDYEFEDREEGSFFRRHIRGFVGLILIFLLAAICFIWATTNRGQTLLATMNLAWKPEVYAELAYEAYQNDYNLQAARYYEQAYNRDTDNYTYAHSAMVAYYDADDLENATTMLKICVELQPNNPEPYAELLILYPDEATRPWEITELIRDGYQRTGDARLNLG